MKRTGVILAAIGGLLMIVSQVITPAVATHVQEPTAPITTVDLRVLHYADPRVFSDCDGSEFPFTKIRIEMYAEADTRPSEHFTAQLNVERLVFGPNGGFRSIEKQWSTQWRHSNVPPHFPSNPWKATGDHTNTWIRTAGVYRVTATFVGDESGVWFQEICEFEVPVSALTQG